MFIAKQQSPMSITLSQQKKELVKVSAPAFLSKQAIEAQKSLEKLKAANKKWQIANDTIPITQSKQIHTIETDSQKSDDQIINIYQNEETAQTNKAPSQPQQDEEEQLDEQVPQPQFNVVEPESKEEVPKQPEEKQVIGQVQLVASVESLQHQKKQASQSSAAKTYNKMTSEEADVAYQQRQNMIKTHIKKTKMAFKSNAPKEKNNQKKVILGQQSEQKFNKVTKGKKQGKKEEEEGQKNVKMQVVLSEKKKDLLEDILRLDQEIQLAEQQLVQEQKQTHRGNLLYQKGKQSHEKKKKMQHATQAQKRQEESKECTFKPKITKAPMSRQTEQEKVSGISCAQSSSFFSTKPASAKPKRQQQNFQVSPPAIQKQFQDYFTGKDHQKNQNNPPELFPTQDVSAQLVDHKLSSITNMYQQLLEQASKIREQLNP